VPVLLIADKEREYYRLQVKFETVVVSHVAVVHAYHRDSLRRRVLVFARDNFVSNGEKVTPEFNIASVYRLENRPGLLGRGLLIAPVLLGLLGVDKVDIALVSLEEA